MRCLAADLALWRNATRRNRRNRIALKRSLRRTGASAVLVLAPRGVGCVTLGPCNPGVPGRGCGSARRRWRRIGPWTNVAASGGPRRPRAAAGLSKRRVHSSLVRSHENMQDITAQWQRDVRQIPAPGGRGARNRGHRANNSEQQRRHRATVLQPTGGLVQERQLICTTAARLRPTQGQGEPARRRPGPSPPRPSTGQGGNRRTGERARGPECVRRPGARRCVNYAGRATR
jgi:hypothetical protein